MDVTHLFFDGYHLVMLLVAPYVDAYRRDKPQWRQLLVQQQASGSAMPGRLSKTMSR
jgi:hypothetical protein